jgi:hypothetical protein
MPRPFHVLAVGWLEGLGREIAARGDFRMSFLQHPRHCAEDFPGTAPDTYFFRSRLREPLPEPDAQLLASLEQTGVPTIHNMLLADSVVSTLDYRTGLSYATLLARRLAEIFAELRPDVVIGSFDGLHSSMGLAVARRAGIPWYALNYSVIPPGYACFCDAMSPSARVPVAPRMPDLREVADAALRKFEERSLAVPAYITPPALSVTEAASRLPARVRKAFATLQRARDREYLQVTEHPSDYDLAAALRHLVHVRAAHGASRAASSLDEPPAQPFVLFGLHTQPESAIDVWAPFYSDQFWVIQTLARALPASHALLVKVHKSDAAKYSSRELRRLAAIPGVRLVRPFADVRRFVDRASMIVSIQGTMGLEGGLLGKPVIMLGDSPATIFPSVERVGELSALPDLMRSLLAKPRPSRAQILDAFVEYLSPFVPAAHNDWTVRKTAEEIAAFAQMFRRLEEFLANQPQRGRSHG